jgi:hypothetical protein
LPGCGELAPCGISAHGYSFGRLGRESELRIGSCIFAPFNESEQLGSLNTLCSRCRNLSSPFLQPSGHLL